MDKEDRMFWEGFLRGIHTCEYAIDKGSDESVVRASIGLIKRRAETLLTNDALGILEMYKTDAEARIAWTEIVKNGDLESKVR